MSDDTRDTDPGPCPSIRIVHEGGAGSTWRTLGPDGEYRVEPGPIDWEPAEGVDALYDGAEVPLLRTELDDITAVDTLAAGYVMAFGASPSRETLAVAWAHWCHETGRGKVGMWNWNFGNQDVTPEYTGDYFELKAKEVKPGGDTYSIFKKLRAYKDAASGAKGYWERMLHGYPRSLAAFGSGDGNEAAMALKSERYYTGSLPEYIAALASLVREFHRRFSAVTP